MVSNLFQYRLRIFVSHSSKDNVFGARLIEDLRQALNDESAVWYDSQGGLYGGDIWWRKIITEVTERNVFIVVLSPDALDSHWVNAEIEMACRAKRSQEKIILPVVYRNCQIPPELKGVPSISFLPPRTYEEAFREVLRELSISTSKLTNPALALRKLPRRTVLVGLLGVGILAAGGFAVTRWFLGQPRLLYTYQGHSDQSVGWLAWSPDSKRIASGGDDSTLQVWNAADGSLTYIWHTSYVAAVAWSPDGKHIASVGDGDVQVWGAIAGNTVYTYHGHNAVALTWSPNGTRIASSSQDGSIQVWDATNGHNLYAYHGHSSDAHAIAWSPDGGLIASGGYDKTVQVWNANDGGHVYTYHGHSGSINALTWSPDSKRIASGSDDATVQVWNATDGGHAYTYREHVGVVYAISWSPDGTRIVSADGDVRVWNANDGGHVYTYSGSSSNSISAHTVAWSPDGTRIALAPDTGTVQIWTSPGA